jgi:hypothetical protein
VAAGAGGRCVNAHPRVGGRETRARPGSITTNVPVIRSPISATTRSDVVTRGTKGRDDGEVTALVGEKAHPLTFGATGALTDEHDFFVRERISRVPHGGLNVLTRQPWVGAQQVTVGSPFAQSAQNQLDRDPRPADHRLPEQ